MVEYPVGPFPPVREPVSSFGKFLPPTYEVKEGTYKGKKFRLLMRPGEGINAAPFEAEELLDLTFKIGGGTGIIYGILFQLGKWGYDSAKVDEWLEVSPVFTEYYQKTIEEKRKMEEEIKAGLASISNAITDFELLAHDARKYKQYLQYFKIIKQLEKELEKTKKPEDAANIERKLREANHVLRALFIDYVDAHAGEGIALKTITPRWPTIISDFMELTDEEIKVESIIDRLKVSRAEAVILVTKNKLYNEWKSLFFDTVKGRYERLLGLMKAREHSIRQYREQMKPLLYRHRTIKTGTYMTHVAPLRFDAQAVSVDHTEVWAWRPFVVPEVFKIPRESYDRVTMKEAGFSKEELDEIKNISKANKERPPSDVPRLPAVPIMDDVVRVIIAQIEKEYELKISMQDVLNVINNLSKRFGTPERPAGIKAGIKWPFSPYFIFVLMAIDRTILKLPDGTTLEDIWIEPLKTFNMSQNILIGRLLEIEAKKKVAARETALLLGEQIIPEGEGKKLFDVDDLSSLVKEEFPEFEKEYEGPKEEKPKTSEEFEEFKKKTKEFSRNISDFLSKFGIDMRFAHAGTYEKFMFERMTKMMQLGPGIAHITISEYLKKASGVPGAEVRVWL